MVRRNTPSTLLPRLLLVLLLIGTTARAQNYSVLFNFGDKGEGPWQPFNSGIVAQGQDGDLYTSSPGGANGSGSVFKITPAGTVTEVYSFSDTDGRDPAGGLTLGTDGNFYGTTIGGLSTFGWGTIFKINPKGKLTALYNFTNGSDGAYPYAPPIEGADGNFYGTTSGSGGAYGSFGTVYKITPSGTFSLLYAFDSTHGALPYAPLVQGIDGNFYGTTHSGGTQDWGTVFRITPGGRLTVLYNFDYVHGGDPFGPLIQGENGNLYGTAAAGGVGQGVIFEITPKGAFAVLHTMNSRDGAEPIAGLVQATDGNFYGVNAVGGVSNGNCPQGGCGTIFRLTPQGRSSVLHNFTPSTGAAPLSTPVQHTNGLIYGDTYQGGSGTFCLYSSYGCGVFYSLDVGRGPFITFVQSMGRVGRIVQILGQGVTGTTSITFNGVPAASFKVVSDTYMTAAVPSGATTGPVVVTTPAGTLTSNKNFIVEP